jgi:hypothetical protein
MQVLYSYPQNRFAFGRGIFYRLRKKVAGWPHVSRIRGKESSSFEK